MPVPPPAHTPLSLNAGGVPRRVISRRLIGFRRSLIGSRRTDIQWSAALSPREREVALLVARGLSNKEVARELGLSEETVKAHVHSILHKLRQLLRN